MPRKPTESKIASERKERLILETWQENLEEYAGFSTFFRWVEKNHPQIIAQYRKGGAKTDPRELESISHDITQLRELLGREKQATSEKMADLSRNKGLTKKALANRISVRKNNGDKTTLTELAYDFDVCSATLRGFVNENCKTDWKSYVQQVLEQE